jgi:probable F420-dependent oxidoreductase
MLEGLEFSRLHDAAQAAEALGFDLLTFPDHFILEQPGGGYDSSALRYDAIVNAAVAAQATTRVKIGHMVLCNLFRHPAITAQSLLSLDHLSNGRLIAGLGAGWTAREFAMTGILFPSITTRLWMLEEALAVIRDLWTKERTTFAGEFYNLREAVLSPKPLQKPCPPILVGGSGRGVLRIAARHADIVNIIVELGRSGHLTFDAIGKLTADAFQQKVAFVREQASKAGRDPAALTISSSIFAWSLVDSPSQARKEAAKLGALMGSSTLEVLGSPLFLFGTAEAMVGELKRRAGEWGVSQFVFAAQDPDEIRRLAEQVLVPLRT